MAEGVETAEGASGRRRYWTAEEKRQIVELTLSSSLSVASVARQHGVNANQVFYWRKLYHAGQLGGERAGESPSLCLLPVSVGNEEPSEADASETERAAHESAEPPMTMNIEFPGGALVSLAGAVDAKIVRAGAKIDQEDSFPTAVLNGRGNPDSYFPVRFAVLC